MVIRGRIYPIPKGLVRFMELRVLYFHNSAVVKAVAAILAAYDFTAA